MYDLFSFHCNFCYSPRVNERVFFPWLLGVLHTSVVLLTEMCERSPDMLAHFRKVSVNLVTLQNFHGFVLALFFDF